MTDLVFYLVLFVAVGVFFVFFHLMLGKIVRPAKPDADKLSIYECGEPTIGSAWVQFDLRYYVVALLFVIFDVEVAFFFPWAVVFGHANALVKEVPADIPKEGLAADKLPPRAALAVKQMLPAGQQVVTEDTVKAAGRLAWLAFVDIAVFFGVLLVGFAYLWNRGDLNWVRSIAEERAPPRPDGQRPEARAALAAIGDEAWAP